MPDKELQKVGRPTKMDVATVTKLEQAFAIGASDTEACSYAGISRQTYYKYLKSNPEFVDKVQHLKVQMPMKAKNELAHLIKAGNERAIFWYLDRYEKRDKQDQINEASRDALRKAHIQEINRLNEIRAYTPEEQDRVEEYALCLAQVKIMRARIEIEGETLYSEKTGGVYTNPLYNQLQSVQNRMDKLRDSLFPVNKDTMKTAKDIRDEFI